MKRNTKIIIGIIAVLLVLIIIGNSNKNKQGSEFDTLLRRSFLLGIELEESSLNLIEKGKYLEVLRK